RLNETLGGQPSAGSLSEVPTEAVEVERRGDDTEPDRIAPILEISPTRPMSIPQGGLGSTKGPTIAGETGGPDRLSFAMEEDPHLQSEAERLKAMLNAVRF